MNYAAPLSFLVSIQCLQKIILPYSDFRIEFTALSIYLKLLLKYYEFIRMFNKALCDEREVCFEV